MWMRSLIIQQHLLKSSNAEFKKSGQRLGQWFSNGEPQEVARCAANFIKVYFKNEKKPIRIEIFIASLKYINIFLILYKKCARKCLYILQWAVNQKFWEPLV
jgi:hypothetical protein